MKRLAIFLSIAASISLFYWFMLGGRNTVTVSFRKALMSPGTAVQRGESKDTGTEPGDRHSSVTNEHDSVPPDEPALLRFSAETRADFGNLDPNTASCIVISGGESKTHTFSASGRLSPLYTGGSSIGLVVHFGGGTPDPGGGAAQPLRNAIIIMLPPDAARGQYTQQSDNFSFYYFPEKNDDAFRPARDLEFSLSIVEWSGKEGRARGVFSGTLRSVDADSTVTVKNGRFDIGIR